MAYLLDTHALLWAIGEPDRLSGPARALISDRATELAVSAASAWEIATKHRLGKLPGAAAVVENWDAMVDRLGARDLPVSSGAALLAGSLGWAHRDPFDRMLAAQSILERMPLISADRAFADLASVRVRW